MRDDHARMRRFSLSLLSQGFMTLGMRTNLNCEITEHHIDQFAEAAALAFAESANG